MTIEDMRTLRCEAEARLAYQDSPDLRAEFGSEAAFLAYVRRDVFGGEFPELDLPRIPVAGLTLREWATKATTVLREQQAVQKLLEQGTWSDDDLRRVPLDLAKDVFEGCARLREEFGSLSAFKSYLLALKQGRAGRIMA